MNQINVGRIEDLPYYTSPPIEFTYRKTAVLATGAYLWADLPTILVPNRPVLSNAVYYFRSISLSADLDELDFMSNIVVVPQYQMYRKGGAMAIMFREPIYMTKYFQNFDYRLAWISQQHNDQLFASFNGSLTQGPTMIGKSNITLTAIVSAQEIADEGFVQEFKKKYGG